MDLKKLTPYEQRQLERERREERCEKIASELLQKLRDHEVTTLEFRLIDQRLQKLVDWHINEVKI